MNCLTTKLVNRLTTKLMNCLIAKLVDRLTAKLMVVNLVKLHLTKLIWILGAIESVLIMGVSILVLSGSCYESKKYKFCLKNTIKK